MNEAEKQKIRQKALKHRRLKGVVVKEVSVVDKPATGRTFALFKSRGADVCDQYDGPIVNYDFNNVLSEGQQMQVLKTIERLNKRLDDLAMATIPAEQKAVLLDTLLLEAGMVRLFKRSEKLYFEFVRAGEDELKNDWIYTRDPDNGIPIIQKKEVAERSPFVTNTHIFKEGPDGRWAWYPKQPRDAKTGQYQGGGR
jgi:hypothetical protein